MESIRDKITRAQPYLIVILLLIIGLGWKCSRDKEEKIDQLETLNKAEADTLRTLRNKSGQQEAVISSYQSDMRMFLEHESDDSLTLQLQQELKAVRKELKNVKAAVIAKSETSIKGATITNISYDVDSNPVYKSALGDRWYNANIVASKDSTSLDLIVRNEYKVVFGEEKRERGIFKGRTPIVKITNINPYTETTDARSYDIPEAKQKRIGIGPVVSYGLDVTSFQPKLVLGVGIQYNLIYLK